MVGGVTQVQSLSSLLRIRALEQSADIAYRFLSNGAAGDKTITYGELDKRVRTIGGWLQSIGAVSQPIALIFPPGLDFVAAFFGVLYAGSIAVPLNVPGSGDATTRLVGVLGDTVCRIALVPDRSLQATLHSLQSVQRLPKIDVVSTDSISETASAEWRDTQPAAETLAVLQYTSGSTASPKGVKISHANFLHNLMLMTAVSDVDRLSIGVSWLPHYHDMGLVGGVLMPLYAGFPAVLLSPTSFLARPIRWLEAISRFRATVSGGPNFGYELCARRIASEDLKGLDLSSWRTAYSGAEPVRADSIARFYDVVRTCGFRKQAIFPCYGLAEATLMVSGSHWTESSLRRFSRTEIEKGIVCETQSASNDSVVLVASGAILDGHRVAIVDPDRRTCCPSGTIGEIWIRADSVGGGYWERPVESADIFGAFLADGGEGPFLRTGDLGFIIDRNLFVTGRRKDILIIRGLNHYPQDIEQTIESSVPSIRRGYGAAFSVEVEGEERLVVVYEVDRASATFTDLFRAISQAVAAHHGLQVYSIAFVKRNSIPKTTSGKIRRQQCRSDFLAGKFVVVADWQSGIAPERPESNVDFLDILQLDPADQKPRVLSLLISELAALLGISAIQIEPSMSIYELGVDSLMAARLRNRFEKSLNVNLEVAEFLKSPAIEEVATQIVHRLNSGSESESGRTIDRLFKQVSELSDEEVSALLRVETQSHFPEVGR